MENYLIQEWEASYYCWVNKVWNYGKLCLCSKYLCFYDSNSKVEEPNFVVDLRRITGFQRRLVSLIYRAVVVNVEGEKPGWFSSLQNREETFYFLEHFWKQRLFHMPGIEQKQQARNCGPTSSTNLAERRQKLFQVLYDSENTLTEAGDSLFNQGEQLDHSSYTMNKMHRDLNITETIINGLDRWFTRWDINSEYYFEIKQKKEHPVLYRKNLKEIFYPGTLVFTEGRVTVLNMTRVADVSILLKDLTSIVVNTPWNIMLVRSAFGEVDVMIDISSTHVVYILKTLQHDHENKFHYEELPLETKQTVQIPDKFAMKATEKDTDVKLSKLSDADLEAVSDVVGNMKSMAVGINQEMTRQLDSVDQLSESVDKANSRIKKGRRKVQEKL